MIPKRTNCEQNISSKVILIIFEVQKMKQQIATYFREYRENFRQKPFQTVLVLILQILFLLGWAAYFYYTVKHYATVIIPGKSEPKGNIYIETIDDTLELLIYAYVFIKLWPLMFDNNKQLRWRFIALLISFLMDLILIFNPLSISDFLPKQPDISEAFWCWSCGN